MQFTFKPAAPGVHYDSSGTYFFTHSSKTKIRNSDLYISGGISEFISTHKNLPAFRDAETRLNALGFKSIVPHDLHNEAETKTNTWEEFMLRDTAALLKCGVVAMLPNWLRSDGAVTEYLNAKIHGIPVICAETLQGVILTEIDKAELFCKITKLMIKSEMKMLAENL